MKIRNQVLIFNLLLLLSTLVINQLLIQDVSNYSSEQPLLESTFPLPSIDKNSYKESDSDFNTVKNIRKSIKTVETEDPKLGMAKTLLKTVNSDVVSGNIKIAVILTEFTSIPHVSGQNISYYQNLFKEVNYYYQNVSREAVSISADIFDNSGNWYNVGSNSSYWVSDDFDEFGFADYVLGTATDPSIDFSAYELTIIVHSGTNQQSSLLSGDPSTQYLARYSTPSHLRIPFITLDSNEINGTIVIADDLGSYQLGTCAHEIGHHLGLQDLYTNSLLPSGEVVLYYDLMYGGNYLMPPTWIGTYGQNLMGWLEYQPLPRVSTQLVVSPLESLPFGAKVYTIPVNSTSYYILEVRNKSINYWDSVIDNNFREGVLIYYVDDSKLEGDVIYDVTFDDDPYVSLLDSNPNDGNPYGSPFGLSEENNSYYDSNAILNITVMNHLSDGSYVISIAFELLNHAPISIDGNDDFITQAALEGWIGNGTVKNPFIIKGYNITSSNISIEIRNVDYHFQIQNCSLDGNDSHSISCSNVSNSSIVYCSIKSGIFFNDSEYNLILFNDIDEIDLFDCKNFNITNNNIGKSVLWEGQWGISLRFSNTTRIENNNISNNIYGIYGWNSNNNTIINNSLFNSGVYFSGYSFEDSYQFDVKDNFVNGKPLIFWQSVNGGSVPMGSGQIILLNSSSITVSGQILSNTTCGLSTAFCQDILIQNNTIYNTSNQGIRLDYSNDVTIMHNTIGNCGIGIFLYLSNTNSISLNTLIDNKGYGLFFSASEDNLIQENNFIGNNIDGSSQAFDTSNLGFPNFFNNNYWDSWTNPDQNDDNIVDNPYSIDGSSNSSDLNPLVNLLSFHYLSKPFLISPNGGETLVETITIQWATVTDSLGHTITYTVSYSANSGTSWIMLGSGLTGTTYVWDTITVADGSTYLIQVNASCSNSLWQSDTSDSTFAIDNPEPHTLSIPTLSAPNGGETLVETITIQWIAATDSLDHTVTYTVSYSANSGASWIMLGSGLTGTTYVWDTSTVADGSTYLIQINASCLIGLWQSDTSDNTFTIDNLELTTTTTTTTTQPDTSTNTTTTTTTTTIAEIGTFPGVLTVLAVFGTLVIFTRRRRKV